MANTVSLEFLESLEGTVNGLATLDDTGKIPVAQVPDMGRHTYKGEYDTDAALTEAYPTGELADHAFITATKSYWYWNPGFTTPAWVNQEITEANYKALPAEAKAYVHYLIIG